MVVHSTIVQHQPTWIPLDVCLNAFWISSFYFAAAACVAASIYANSGLGSNYENLLWRLAAHFSVTVVLCLFLRCQQNHPRPVKTVNLWALLFLRSCCTAAV